jgi:glycosyltransferase involved in cell wall biosynthesis
MAILPRRCLSVIVPAYNEEATIAKVLRQLLLLDVVLEVVVVNDCSHDRTGEIVQELVNSDSRIALLHHTKNRGKTESLKTGFAAAKGELIIVQDADLEYDPTEIPVVIQPILDGNADVVYGSRFLIRKAARVLYFYHYLANKLLTFVSNLFTNINLTDIETGYKAFRSEYIQNMIITSSGFGFEIEVTAKLAKLRCAMYEVPISYYGRTYEEGKKIGVTDGVAALWYIIKYNVFCGLKSSYTVVPHANDAPQTPANSSEGAGPASILNSATGTAAKRVP